MSITTAVEDVNKSETRKFSVTTKMRVKHPRKEWRGDQKVQMKRFRVETLNGLRSPE